jgi:small subunit ribosomal protein S1
MEEPTDMSEPILPVPESAAENLPEAAAAIAPEIFPEPVAEPVFEEASLPAPELSAEALPEPVQAQVQAQVREPAPVSVSEPLPEPAKVPSPEPIAEAASESEESFADLLKEFDRSHRRQSDDGQRQLQATVVSLSADQVFLDIGFKVEGVLPRSSFKPNADKVKLGDTFPVSVKGRNEEGYYELSRFKVAQPRDWSALQAAFDQKTPVVATVTAVVKGGVSVDVGVRAFMPASRSGTRDAAELEKLVGTEITCRITKLDVADENVVVDRRGVLEEQARSQDESRRSAMSAGDIVHGTVRSLVPYGAFVDLGGIDGLLHISDIAHSRVSKSEDALTVGQQLELKILKIDPETRKISLGLKQLQAEPWLTAADRYKPGDRVTGKVTRVQEFGAFVEVEPGIEGLIHVSEISWGKKVRSAADVLKQGDTVDAVILGIKLEERRLSLGLKQTLGDPWAEVPNKFPIGAQIEGPITKLMNFGAFVQIAEGIEGLVHVSEISADKHIHHPQDVLRAGQVVKAQVLAIDGEKRQIKLSMKQLIPTSIDEYIAEHAAGDLVSGRVVEEAVGASIVELGEGIRCACKAAVAAAAEAETASAAKVDLSGLSSMLKARWKGDTKPASAQPEPLQAGQIRTFRITKLDAEAKKIEVELA